MTRAPFVMGKADSAFSRTAKIEDTTIGWRFVNPLMKAKYGVDSMPETAENVAAEFGVTRADQDAFALRSQQRYARAHRGEVLRQRDHAGRHSAEERRAAQVRRRTSIRARRRSRRSAKLKGVVKPDGTVTAGNASGVNDGSCALLLASEEAAAKYGLRLRARVIATATAGVPPRIMGIGPVPATRKVLALAKLAIGQMDVIELNEAFAAQALAVTRQLGLAGRCRARESERRRDRDRSSARRERRATGDDGAQSAGEDRRDATRCARCASAWGRASRW